MTDQPETQPYTDQPHTDQPEQPQPPAAPPTPASDSTDIRKLLGLGRLAKKNVYQQLLRKVADQSITAAEMKVLQALEKDLQSIASAGSGPSETLPNLPAVVAYLNGQGWKLSHSTAYEHRGQGKIRPQPDGTFLISDVERYGATFLKRKDGSSPAAELEKLQRQKLEEETRRIRAQADHWYLRTRILNGRYAPVDQMDIERASRASIFRSDFENAATPFCTALIAIVGGDPAKLPDAIVVYLDRLEKIIARYAEKREFTATVDASLFLDDDDPLEADPLDAAPAHYNRPHAHRPGYDPSDNDPSAYDPDTLAPYGPGPAMYAPEEPE